MKTIENTVAGTEKLANQSTDKLLQILECMSEERLPVRLQDLSAKLGMSQSTALRYLNSLQNSNYVYQEESTSRYALTWKICRLGENINTNLGLRSITTPYVTSLVNRLDLGVCLVTEDDYECMYLDCIDPSPSFKYSLQRIGKRAPMHATGSGKIFLSQYTPSELDTFIEKKGLYRLTDNTITSKARLIEELEIIRETLVGYDKQECEPDLFCVSSPLFNYSGTVVAAMSVFGLPEVMTDEKISGEILPALKEATSVISRHLGYDAD